MNTSREQAGEICLLLDSLDVSGGTGDRYWTLCIKRQLAALGATHGYETCASGLPEQCEREWLYDLVWFRNGPDGTLQSVGLVAESEWSRNFSYIRYDFEKLLVAGSPLKLMIFQCREDELEGHFSKLEQSIRNFSQQLSGQIYVLAAVDTKNWDFHHRIVES
jgi:hypothetical protein